MAEIIRRLIVVYQARCSGRLALEGSETLSCLELQRREFLFRDSPLDSKEFYADDTASFVEVENHTRLDFLGFYNRALIQAEI